MNSAVVNTSKCSVVFMWGLSMDCLVKLAILVQIVIVVSIDIAISADCSNIRHDVHTFKNCQYRCHCKNAAQCSQDTGECTNGCEFGWMGPGCQYRNIAKNYSSTKQHGGTNVQSDYATRAVDGNLQTCSKTGNIEGSEAPYWYITFDETHEVLGLVIKVPSMDVGNFRMFRITTGNQNDTINFPTLCYQHANTSIEQNMEILCDQPTMLKQLKLTFSITNVPLRLCEVEIYGGRSVTFNKPTEQKNTYYSTSSKLLWNASRAVDGRVLSVASPDAEHTCSATNYTVNPWWRVDLRTHYVLHDVQFYGRMGNEHQFKGFYLLYGTKVDSMKQLYHDTSPRNVNATNYQPMDIPVTSPVSAQYLKIMFKTNTHEKPALMAICEVLAFGECPQDKCGWDCSKSCHCSTNITGRYKIEGSCPHGCSGRWTGDDDKCDHDCGVSKWGSRCEETCGNCMGNRSCDVITGECMNGCSGPWMPPKCTKECKYKYGVNCSFNCGNCKDNASCNVQDGTCKDGCLLGWSPPMCERRCENRMYGFNCLTNCGQCANEAACDVQTGDCPDGCEIGYITNTCDKKCDSGKFGHNCSRECGHCYNAMICNFQTGVCPKGCDPGFMTEYCNETCPDGFFGLNCSGKCGFCTDKCNKSSGHCSGGCNAGYKGDLCKQKCENRTYGYNCSSNCGKCAKQASCDVQTGDCPDGCEIGYRMKTCNKQCENRTYGYNCSSNCGKCAKQASCDVQTGDCPDGCEIGYRMKTCNKQCENRTYGYNCSSNCGKCAKQASCDVQTGDCPDGCEIGYRMKTCNKQCENRTYGYNCSSNCGKCAKQASCDVQTGDCPDGCEIGYRMKTCNKQCENRTYGYNCSSNCGKCANQASCDVQTGDCPYGCEIGYRMKTCNKPCPVGFFGLNCSKKCGFCTNECNKSSGHCSGGCKAGYKGDLCKQMCDLGTFGHNCSSECGHCYNATTCNFQTGVCLKGCDPGFMTEYCNDKCENRTYGYNCSANCGKCAKQASCDVITGECPYGCKIGYRVKTCDKKCDSGTFGNNCSSECGHCYNATTCNFQTGVCPNGCDSGFMTDYCNETCLDGYFGTNCSERCGFCANECNKSSGHCFGGCQAGYKGDLCKKTCKPDYYGHKCANKCGMCKSRIQCDKETGYCPNGCQIGWKNDKCSTRCDDGTYGVDCKQTCGHCSGTDACHSVTGACPYSCKEGYIGSLCTEEEPTNPGPIIGAVVALVLLLLAIVVVILVVLRKRKQPVKYHEEMTASVSNPEYLSGRDSEKVETPKSRDICRHVDTHEDNVYGNEIADKNDILVTRLRVVSQTAKSTPEPFYADFEELPYGLNGDASVAKRQKNKNKYKEMYPYNFNRVILPKIIGIPDSSYINASYINGHSEAKKYIASQGPIKDTVADMWRMVWTHNVTTIVMLTNCYEAGKSKCEQYWPDERQSQTYGDISVDSISSDVYADFCVRKFRLTEACAEEQQMVCQYHYTAWPDKDVPDTALSLVQFWRAVRKDKISKAIPWVVHCSAGVGRTGTFIGLDFLYDQGSAESIVNVKGGVNSLRQQRVNMIQTKEQYVLLHESLAEALCPIGSVYKAEDFVHQVQTLVSTSGVPQRALENEYEAVSASCRTEAPPEDDNVYYNVSIKVDGEAGKSINLSKSRFPNIYPDDLHRPLLSRIPVKGHNEFINAVYISTFRKLDGLILTQVPLESTAVDFVRMLWDTNISTIVLLEDSIDEECCYWPVGESPSRIGPIQCKLLEEKQCEHYIVRVIKYTTDIRHIQDKEKVVHQFHFKSWLPDQNIPDSTRGILGLVSGVEENVRFHNQSQIIVQCLDGAKKSGLFSVLWTIMERMKTDQEVGIAETVRLCRKRRQQVINNIEQYAFCYCVVKHFMENMDLYSNLW